MSTTRAANTGVETVKIIGLRRRIAQKMAESKRRVAHFSYVEEVDVTALEELRATLNAENRQDRPRLTLMPFLMKALVKAVAHLPVMKPLHDERAGTLERPGRVPICIPAPSSRARPSRSPAWARWAASSPRP